MKEKFLIILFTSVSSYSFSQQLINEFYTTHNTSEMGNVKLDVKWSLYDDRIVMAYTDKFTIKTMKQIGQEPFTVLPYKLTKESNDSSMWYFYQDDVIQIKIILEGIPKPSVTIKTKQDAFTGAVGTSSLYYSLLN